MIIYTCLIFLYMCISLFYRYGELKIVDYLVKEASANIYCKDIYDRTPLDVARE